MKSCLVVDDSRVVRHLARRIVEDLGFEVEEAEDGRVALDCCLRHMPHVVLLDWNMPVMNGIDFLRKLRGTKGGDRPVVVFLTTENGLPQIEEAIAAGANEYIMKPFDSEIVADKFKLAGVL
jgi:two-component system chemotaxis response regulator CheY